MVLDPFLSLDLLNDRSYTPCVGRTSGAREQLIQSAKELMAGRSYATVGVDELCKSAGVKKGSFYYFFPSKKKLAIEVIGSYLEDHEERFTRALDTDRSPLERICGLIHLYYELHCLSHRNEGHIRGCPLANLALELSTQDELIRRELVRAFGQWVKRVETVLVEAMAAEEIEKRDPATAALELLAYFEGVVLLAKTRNDPGVIKKLEPGLLRLLGASFAKPAQGRTAGCPSSHGISWKRTTSCRSPSSDH